MENLARKRFNQGAEIYIYIWYHSSTVFIMEDNNLSIWQCQYHSHDDVMTALWRHYWPFVRGATCHQCIALQKAGSTELCVCVSLLNRWDAVELMWRHFNGGQFAAALFC